MYGLSQLQTRNQKLERIVQLMFSRQNMTEVECQVDAWSFPTSQQPYHGVNPRRSFKGSSFRIDMGRNCENNCTLRRWCNGTCGVCTTQRRSAVESRMCAVCQLPPSVVQRSQSLERRSLFDWAILRLPPCFWNGGAVFDGQPKTKRSVELKSETSRVLGEFTGFDALFSTRCKPALDLILIGLPNKKQPRFTVFRRVYRFPAIL